MRSIRCRHWMAALLLGLVALPSAEATEPTFAYETMIDGYYLSHGKEAVVDEVGNAYVIASWYSDQQHLDILVIKLDPAGDPVWTVPIVGEELEHDSAADIALDSEGNLWITGWTSSDNFPTTPDALYPTQIHFQDAFLMKMDPEDGAILYCTYLGGDYTDRGAGITLNEANEIYVVGVTGSTDYPTTPDAYQGEPSAPLYAFTDAFITKFSPDGRTILYSTYFGGYEDDWAENVDLDQGQNIVVSGRTRSDDFPLINPIQSTPNTIFVSQLSADGSTLQFSTYLGGDDVDAVTSMAVDGEDYVYLTGYTRSIDFPTTPGSFQDTFIGEILGCEEGFPPVDVNCSDGFVVKMATDGTGMVYGTFLGGLLPDQGRAIAVDETGSAHVAGYTVSADFLGTGNVYASIFVAKLNPSGSELEFALTKQSSSANAGHGLALDASNDVYFAGAVHAPADIYIAKLFTQPASVGSLGDMDGGRGLRLAPCTPNPFASAARIAYAIPSTAGASAVKLTVHDASGRLVRTLVEGTREPGVHSATWDGTDHAGQQVSTGVYLYNLRWNGEARSRRVLLLR